MHRFARARLGPWPLGLAVVAGALVASAAARADDAVAPTVPAAAPSEKQVCAEAYKTAQVKRDAARLLEAREDLRACSRPVCPGFIAKDCTGWLAEVESRVSSIVLSVKEGERERFDASVTMDGKPLATTLDGRAIEVDPGLHAFVFVLPGGARRDVRAAVKEGWKAQTVAALFPGLGADDRPAPPQGNTLKLVGYATGGVGVIALGLGAVFGARAISKNADSKKDCDAESFCGPDGKEARDDAQQAATLSTVGVVAGGVLLAGGVTLVLLAPKSRRSGTSAAVVPMVGGGSGGMWLTGDF